MRMNSKLLLAFGVGFVATAGATLAQSYGRGRNVQFVDGATISPTSVQASGAGDQFMCTSTTATCEVESSVSAATMTATVPAFDIGPTATPGANDRLACFSYGPSGSKTRMMCVDAEGDINANSLALGTTPSGIRAHFLAETTSYAPNSFDQKHVVFGRAPALGATSGGVFMTYHTVDNEGLIGALSPTAAWRPLRFGGSEWKFQQSGNLVVANINGTGTINSAASSGNQAFTCTNTGCRLSLGNTGRYLVDDGTNLEFVAPVQATSFESLATSGSSFTGGNSSTSLTITSNTPDSVTSTTVPAIRLKASQDIADTDLLLLVEDSAGNRRLTLTEVGNFLVLPDTFGTFVSGSSGSFSNPNNTANIIGNRSSDQFSIGVILRNATNLTTAGARLVAFRNATTDVASVDKDGLLRVNENNRARPTCNSTNRGKLFFLDGAAGVADTMEVCMKDASDVYDWETVASP